MSACINCNQTLTDFDSEHLCNVCWDVITDEGLDVETEVKEMLEENS